MHKLTHIHTLTYTHVCVDLPLKVSKMELGSSDIAYGNRKGRSALDFVEISAHTLERIHTLTDTRTISLIEIASKMIMPTVQRRWLLAYCYR